jgi:ubiquinone/menaquinone biosynthesis C-methylase UbiE
MAPKAIGRAPVPFWAMDDWRTYDRTAAIYERVHAPRLAAPARDLATLAGVAAGARVLDVGTGTGVAAGVAHELGASVVGVDPSEGMLEVARTARPGIGFLAAQAIDLPFANGSFDVVLGTFVLAHFAKVETALFDIQRVTRPGGVLGFTTWTDGRDAFTDTWRELVTTVVPDDLLAPTMDKAIPNHDRFTDRAAVEEVLLDAGLRHVRTEPAQYEWRYGRDEYIDGLTVWATGRFVREMLGEDGWERFLERVRATFAERFPDPLHDRRDVLLAIGTKG